MYKNIQDYHRSLHSGSTTCLQVVDHYLEKIKSAESLNAFVKVFIDESRLLAIDLDKKRNNGEAPGLLHGVVISIKDVICYKGHPVSAASKILSGFHSLYSAAAIERLIAEEAIIIGSCNCDEFAMGSTNENSAYGPVLNAMDHTRVPGGSSGGSAVSVQAGLCMASLGSDTGGSVRQPADHCGITGFKPSYGVVSRHGLIAYASSFDQIGIFANEVEDIELILKVINGPDQYDSTLSQKNLLPVKNSSPNIKIGILKNALELKGLEPEIKETICNFKILLANDGYQVADTSFDLIDFIVPAYYILTTAEASSNLNRYDGVRYGHRNENAGNTLTEMYEKTRSEGFGGEVKKRIMLGTFVLSEGYYDAYFTKAQQVRRLLINQTAELFNNFDFLLMPTVTHVAPHLGDMRKDAIAMYLSDIFTVYANLTGIPAISIPLFRHSGGMPFGVQLMASKHNDLSLLSVSHKLLQAYKTY